MFANPNTDTRYAGMGMESPLGAGAGYGANPYALGNVGNPRNPLAGGVDPAHVPGNGLRTQDNAAGLFRQKPCMGGHLCTFFSLKSERIYISV